ncbi:endoglucanase E-4-like [Liolophura sinensis]|uniref:endoglucanase E-4-like n=1 Tax=Liolophura sinensis TaxID=3198878 RepID=UPI0031585C62
MRMTVLLFVAVSSLAGVCLGATPLSAVDDFGGKFQGHFKIPIKESVDGWEVTMTFSAAVTGLTEWMGDTVVVKDSGRVWVIVNKEHTGILKSGNTLDITVQASYSGTKAPTGSAVLRNLGKDTQTVPPHHHSSGKYDYDDVLYKSLLFYEAQRSGKLPSTNHIPWRHDSATHDRGSKGEDLTGGWYDAGDHVKFGLPMAYSVTILAWGLIQWGDAYKSAGLTSAMYDCIRWPLDYLLKAHTGPTELYVQVGDGGKDHAYWGRPENMTMERPAFKVTASSPGSDVVGETAAAFAASSIAFRRVDATYSAKLLQHAKQLYEFADKHREIYSISVQAAAAYYRSMGYKDELGWSAAWLYQATGDQKYLTAAESYHSDLSGFAWGLSWDDKQAGYQILMYNATKKATYKDDILATFKYWMPGGTIPYSPKGMAFRLQWGPLRYSSNMAFIALMAADLGVNPAEYRKWAKGQIHYALGDSGRSYVVGFGNNYPKRPHHRARPNYLKKHLDRKSAWAGVELIATALVRVT